jgi:lipoprotein-anchoring transpeptidase ErfK/SrfK
MRLNAAAVTLALPLVALAALLAWHAPTQLTSPTSQTDANGQTPTADAQARASRAPLKLPLVNPKIVVSKSARRLELYAGGRVVREYRVVLGGDPVNDKERQGDSRTPEGEFYVCVKNEKSQFYRSLGLSYPNREDAERGLRDKLITSAEYDRIVNAITRKRTPPWNTALGGEIFIHGGGTSNDWTLGCVALDNADMQELFDSVPVGTAVRIDP